MSLPHRLSVPLTTWGYTLRSAFAYWETTILSTSLTHEPVCLTLSSFPHSVMWHYTDPLTHHGCLPLILSSRGKQPSGCVSFWSTTDYTNPFFSKHVGCSKDKLTPDRGWRRSARRTVQSKLCLWGWTFSLYETPTNNSLHWLGVTFTVLLGIGRKPTNHYMTMLILNQ